MPKYLPFASKFILFFILLVCSSLHLAALEKDEKPKVSFPHTDIFLFELTQNEGRFEIKNPKNATNRKGYDNQPYFTKDSQSFLFSRADDYQTDVYEYFLTSGDIRAVTQSDATEFSPTPSPDNTKIAFVSDRNGGVWFGERETINTPRWTLKGSDNREPIGYFAWNHGTGDFFYWSRYGFSMALVNTNSDSYHFVSGNTPPSTPHIIPGTNNFSFVHRQMNEQVWIKSLDPTTKAIKPIVPVMGPNYNYTWSPDGQILMIQNAVLFQFQPGKSKQWEKVADLTTFNIANANRLAVSPNGKYLAVVGQGAD